MSSGVVSDREEILATYAEWEAVSAKVAALSLDALTHTELLELQHRREMVARSVPSVDHQIINRLAAEADPKALGGTSWPMCCPRDCASARARPRSGSNKQSCSDRSRL
jgi:hypothetical protein